ncbi:MAG: heme-binding domain-containing protein [Ferruginibacter sp.]
MKRFFKTLFLVLLVVLVLFQFYPRPAKNIASGPSANDISRVHAVPQEVDKILKTSCYDCHSNTTAYPWYSKIQPVALWLGDHIEEGKGELNFSEFGTYSIRRQYRKLEEINEEVKEGEMPLKSYTFIHRNASLDEKQQLILANWVTALRDSFASNYPPDSLIRKKQ